MNQRELHAAQAEENEAERKAARACDEITRRYREQGHLGKALAARLTRHAKTLSGTDPEVSVALLERAIEIEYQCRRAS